MEEKIKYTKDWLIKTMASRANFTINDTRDLFTAFEEIVQDIIYDKDKLVIPSLFSLSVTTIKAHSGWNAVENKKMEIPESYRINFKASRTLLDLLKEKKTKSPPL